MGNGLAEELAAEAGEFFYRVGGVALEGGAGVLADAGMVRVIAALDTTEAVACAESMTSALEPSSHECLCRPAER